MIRLDIGQTWESGQEAVSHEFAIKLDKNIPPQAVQGMYASVNWKRREFEAIARALENSLAVVSIWDNETLVAMARATGDKVFNATIWDVVVRPSHQGMGLGNLVMKEMLAELDAFPIPLITLYADPGTEDFYKQFGFFLDPSGAKGMFREKAL